jgi:hypothetical protein
MQQVKHPALRRAATIAALAALATLVVTPSARADLADTIAVELVAPNGIESDSTGFTLSQLAPLATGVLAMNLDGAGDISEFMLDDEQITFSGNSILIRVAAGSENGLNPGYGDGAHYLLTGLAVPGETIIGFTVYGFDGYGTTGPDTGLALGVLPDSLVHLGAGAHSMSFDLDNALTFRDRGAGGSLNYAEFRIDLQTQPVPEPSQWLLMLAGLGGVAGVLARRRSAGQ